MEKAARLEEEREAKRVSDAIDRNLEAERQALRKRQKSEIKLLLLGVWSFVCVSPILHGIRVRSYVPARSRAVVANGPRAGSLNASRATPLLHFPATPFLSTSNPP